MKGNSLIKFSKQMMNYLKCFISRIFMFLRDISLIKITGLELVFYEGTFWRNFFSMSLNFKKSALYDEVIKVKTTLLKLPSVKIEFDYEVFNESGDILVTANTVLAFINMKTKRPMKCPDYILEKLGN